MHLRAADATDERVRLVCRRASLLVLLNGTLVDTSALVDQVTGGGRLTGIHVANDHQGNVNLKSSARDREGVGQKERYNSERKDKMLGKTTSY